MRIVLAVPLNVLNARKHWATLARLKKAFWKEADGRQLLGMVPPPPPRPWERVRLHAHFRLHNLMDPDNLRGRVKWAQDWLVTRGYIIDDRASVIVEFSVSQEIDRKHRQLEITLEEVPDADT